MLYDTQDWQRNQISKLKVEKHLKQWSKWNELSLTTNRFSFKQFNAAHMLRLDGICYIWASFKKPDDELDQVKEIIRTKRPKLIKEICLICYQDNSITHTSSLTKQKCFRLDWNFSLIRHIYTMLHRPILFIPVVIIF